MNNDNLNSILSDLAENAKPAAQIDLWPGLKKSLTASDGQSKQGKSMMNRKSVTRRAALAALVVLAAVAIILATPQGQAFCRGLFGYYTTVSQNTLPPVPTPVAAPTFAIEAGLVPQPTSPINQPDCGETISPIDSTFLCQLQDAQNRLGFVVKSFPAQYVQVPFAFMRLNLEQRTLSLSFRDPKISRGYHLDQGLGDFPRDPVYQDAVQNVQVGPYPAEYVAGDFIFPEGQPSQGMVWSPDEPIFRLRWKEGDHWYAFTLLDSQIAGYGSPYVQAHMIQVAENLVSLDQGADQLTAGSQPSIRDTAGFTIKVPGLLPQGFQQVADGTWSNLTTEPRVGMNYEYTVNGQAENALILYEMPIPSDDKTLRREYGLLYQGLSISDTLTASLGEQVQINDLTGYYLDGGESNTKALYWRDTEREYLLIYQWSPSFGGRLDKATLIAIAASLK